MELKAYMDSLDAEGRRAFRERLGYHRLYVSSVANGRREAGPQLAKGIEAASDGMVARWELRPGSYLTAVWNHHGDETVFDQAFSHSLDRLVRAPSTDIVLVKLAWRFAL